MFFGSELLGGKTKSQKKFLRHDMIHQSLNGKKQKYHSPIFGQFAAEIQTKSLEQIAKDYQTNSFFKIKVDLLLKQTQKDSQLQLKNIHMQQTQHNDKNLDTLKSSMTKSNLVRKLVEELKERKKN